MSIIGAESFSNFRAEKLFRQDSTDSYVPGSLFTPRCEVNLNPMALDPYNKLDTYTMLVQNTLNNYNFEVSCTGTYEQALEGIAHECSRFIHYGPDSMGFSERMNGTNPTSPDSYVNPLDYKFRTADGERDGNNRIISCSDSYASLCAGCGTGGGTLCAATIREMIIAQARTRFTEDDWNALCDNCDAPCEWHTCPAGEIAVGTKIDDGDWECRCEKSRGTLSETSSCDDPNRKTKTTGECDNACKEGYGFNDEWKCVTLDSLGTKCSSLNRKGGTCCPCGDCLDGYVIDEKDRNRCRQETKDTDEQMWIVGGLIGILGLGLVLKASG